LRRHLGARRAFAWVEPLERAGYLRTSAVVVTESLGARAKVRFRGRPVTRQENFHRQQWVGSGSSIYTLERPLRCIDLTFSWKLPSVRQQPMSVPAPSGPSLWRTSVEMCREIESEMVVALDRNRWRFWSGIRTQPRSGTPRAQRLCKRSSFSHTHNGTRSDRARPYPCLKRTSSRMTGPKAASFNG
jgi:hypothetical protein